MTRTSQILATDDAPHTALVLVFEGYNLAITDSDDVAALAASWASTSWTNFFEGLEPRGTIRQHARPFDSKTDMADMSLSFVDDDDDSLARIFMRRANNEAAISRLTNLTTAAMDCASPFILMDDSAAFPGSGTVYIGTEEIPYTFNGGGGLLSGLTRGTRALFGTSTDPTHFAQPHGIDFAPNPADDPIFSPRVSTAPLSWHGRAVALYLCVEQDGIWTAGADAECLWAGTIRTVHYDGDGRIRLECQSILKKLEAKILRKQYRGYIDDGFYLPTANGELLVQVWRIDQTTGVITTWQASTTTLLPAADYYSHQEIAALINAQLATWFNGSGTPFPAGMTFQLKLQAGQGYLWEFSDATGGGPFMWNWNIVMSPVLGYLLGYRGWISSAQPKMRVVSKFFGTVPWDVFVPNQPVIGGLPFPDAIGATLRVRDVDNNTAFEAQPSATFAGPPAWLPALTYGGSGATGFLRVGEKVVIAVRPSGTLNEFVFLGYVPQEAVLGLNPIDGGRKDENGDRVPDALESAFEDSRTSQGVRVEQVWLEVGSVADIMLRLIVSTGTPGYNHPTYDQNPEQMGLRVPWQMVNAASFALLGTRPYLLYVDQPSEFLKRFESALQMRNLHAFWHRGQLTITSWGESGAATLRIDEDTKVEVVDDGDGLRPITQPCATEDTLDYLVNQVTLKYNLPLGSYGTPQPSVYTFNNTASKTDLGPENDAPVSVEAIGFYDGVEIVGDTGLVDDWVDNVAAVALGYFGRPVCEFKHTYGLEMVVEMYPGRQVLFSSDTAVDPRTGRPGVTDLPMWVVDTEFDYETGAGEARLIFNPENVT